MPSYSRGKPEIRARVSEVMGRYHGALVEAEVTVGVLMCHPGEGEEHALKLHGYPCAATVKVTPLKQRVMGIEDAIITIDAVTWEGLTEEERVAVIDHELQHLDVAVDKDGEVRADDQGRPRLKMRLHDWELGGFASIAGRHKADALEVQAFRAVSQAYHQQLFRWSDDMAPSDMNPATVPMHLGEAV
jgi:hypothetical protein